MKYLLSLFLVLLPPLALAQTYYVDSASYLSKAHIKLHERSYYEEHSTAYTYTNDEGLTMPYRLFFPPNYDVQKTYPILIYLHGAGSRGDDNLKQLRSWVAGWMDEDLQAQHPCLILMPQCPAKQQWVNVPWKEGSYDFKTLPISQPLQLAKEVVDKVINENAVDRHRIYVMGCSMGGYGTWNFVMHYPELVAAAVPICGAGDPAMAKEIKDLPIWAFHGDQDPTVPLSGSTDMMEALSSFKDNKARLTIYEGVGHNAYEMAWREIELMEWVFSQKKP